MINIVWYLININYIYNFHCFIKKYSTVLFSLHLDFHLQESVTMYMFEGAWEIITLPLLPSAGWNGNYNVSKHSVKNTVSSTKATEWNMPNNESNSSAAFGNVSQFNMWVILLWYVPSPSPQTCHKIYIITRTLSTTLKSAFTPEIKIFFTCRAAWPKLRNELHLSSQLQQPP